MQAEKTAKKQRPRGRPFRPGVSGNPRGRPVGARNRSIVFLEVITDQDLQTIAGKIVEKAKAGNLVAARLIFDRVAPAPKGRAVTIDLPTIKKWDGIDAVLRFYQRTIEAVTNGEISPAEGLELIALIEAQRATVKELRPEAMYRQPTAEQVSEQKRLNYDLAKLMLRPNTL